MYVFELCGLTMKTMMLVSSVLLVCGAFFVLKIKESHGIKATIE